MNSDPFSPPVLSEEPPSQPSLSATHIDRVATIYRWVGWAGILYTLAMYPIEILPYRNGGDAERIVFACFTVLDIAGIVLFSYLVHLSAIVRTELRSVYRKARSVGVLAGLFGFPHLTIPAFYAVGLLVRSRRVPVASGQPSDAPE